MLWDVSPGSAGSAQPAFVAINTVVCRPGYVKRFEELFRTRLGAIDTMPGFLSMQVLKPRSDGQPYLIVSHWASEEAFRAWTGSPKFVEGHRRAFDDMAKAKAAGEEPPMASTFDTYEVLTD